MKFPLFLLALFFALVFGGSGLFAQQPLPLFRFDEIQRYDPEIGQKLGLTQTQLDELQAAVEQRESDAETVQAKAAFEAVRGTDEEASAKEAWQNARWNAGERFREGVVQILTDEQKALIASVEEAYAGIRSEIKFATEGMENRDEIFEKAREIWNSNTAHLWTGKPVETNAAAGGAPAVEESAEPAP